MEQAKQDLLEYLGLHDNTSTRGLDSVVLGNSRYVKDLRINLKNTLEQDHFSAKESALMALSCATALKNETFCSIFNKKAQDAEASVEEVAEAVSCASLLSANNVLYRFKHFMGESDYSHMQAGIRMAIMARPVTGKEFFELMSLAVSAINGCESCVRSHEVSVKEHGGSKERIWATMRMASVLTSADKLIGI
jgi:alkyl hydroperoxide reductase subunit D